MLAIMLSFLFNDLLMLYLIQGHPILFYPRLTPRSAKPPIGSFEPCFEHYVEPPAERYPAYQSLHYLYCVVYYAGFLII
jgi:hypothetical protein